MKITLTPAPLRGRLEAIPSKSDAHRKLICAALAETPGLLWLPAFSKDIEATVACLTALGADFCLRDGKLAVTPGAVRKEPLLNCGESGSTLRFMLPVAAALCEKAHFTGGGRLPARPLAALIAAMAAHGVNFSKEKLPFTIKGKLQPGLFSLPGDVSSQFISGLLLAAPLLAGNSKLRLSSSLQSAGYVDMTLATLKDFGVETESVAGGWDIPGAQRFISPLNLTVEGDWSAAACFLCAAALSGPITVAGLDTASRQGDKAVLAVLRRMGAAVRESDAGITVAAQELRGTEIDVSDIPDLLPVLAVIATAARGETRFTHAARLRFKESDRLFATAALLSSLGGEVKELPDGLIVKGKALKGGTIQSFNDHRIVMAAAIAAQLCKEKVMIDGAEVVTKSYPDFFEDYCRLGGNVIEEA